MTISLLALDLIAKRELVSAAASMVDDAGSFVTRDMALQEFYKAQIDAAESMRILRDAMRKDGFTSDIIAIMKEVCDG